MLISYLNEDEDARETARYVVEEAGRKAVLVPGNISEEAHCQLDILVNNAGFQMAHGLLQEISSEEWDRIFRTNLYAI
ncbi:hypothetical protein GCM10027577_32140 [Spirosoma fluminis]